MNKTQKIFEYLKIIAPIIPAPIYWFDLNSVLLGINDASLEAVGGKTYNDVIGKNPYELGYAYKIADSVVKHNEKVIQSGKTLYQEDTIQNILTGELRYFISVKSPLFDDNGKIIGVIGTSVETTDTKRREHAEQENSAHMIRAEEDEKFRQIVGQVVHDIRAPITSTLAIAKTAASLPENLRVTLRNAANRINDLANSLLRYFNPDAKSKFSSTYCSYKKSSILVSGVIKEMLSEKRMLYYDLPVTFEEDFTPYSHFAFIKIETEAFKRALSNLINNAVDALSDKPGVVTLGLIAEDNLVKVIIKDNGKGMTSDLVEKIRDNIDFTAGKKGGHGLGLSQVRETLQHNHGEFIINSTSGVGTEIILTFPRVENPGWIADTIKLTLGDIVVVLDDDPSIHGAWDAIFENYIPDITLKHFDLVNQAIEFVNSLKVRQKNKVFLLVDYELLGQGLNGLDVVAQTGIKRSIVVTSHHENKDIQEHAKKTNTRILPKLLALEVPISIVHKNSIQDYKSDMNTDTNGQRNVDLVLVDDYKETTDALKDTIFKNKRVDIYHNLIEFLNNVNQYPKNTKMLLDNNYSNYNGELEGIHIFNSGFCIAKRLHESGYTNLYLFSGDVFDKVPDYLKIIHKSGLDEIEELLSTEDQKREKIDLQKQLEDVICGFNELIAYELRRSELDDIENTAQLIKQNPLQLDKYIDRIAQNAIFAKKMLAYQIDTVFNAKKIFNNIAKFNDLLECELKDNLIENKLRFALRQNRQLLNNKVKSTFKYMGNVVIVDLILLDLLKYAVYQIRKGNNGTIDLRVNKRCKMNSLYIRYKANRVFATLPEHDKLYAGNYAFCKKAMEFFDGKIIANVVDEESVEFILSFPKMSKRST